MTDNFLFDVPETLSPRLAWRRKHSVCSYFTKEFAGRQDTPTPMPWAAWVGGLDDYLEIMEWEGDDGFGYGDSEDEAFCNLAIKYGLRMWNEEEGNNA